MNARDLNGLIQELLEGTISARELLLLEAELASSEEARTLYLDMAEIHSFLAQQEGIPFDEGKVVSMERIVARQKRRTFRLASFSAAALFLIGLVTMNLLFIAEEPPTLTFETAPGTLYGLAHSGTSEKPPEGMVLEEGSRLQLTQGTVELTFQSGVKSIVMAPADLILLDEGTLFLNRGIAWFRVPEEAIGFQVKTNDLDIIDLGTEFGVLARPDEHDEVHVLAGSIQLTSKRGRRESAIFRGGESRSIDPIGRLTSIPATPSAFLKDLPAELPGYRGPLDLGEGLHVLHKGGVNYSVSDLREVRENGNGVAGNLLIDEGGSLTVVFSSPVDLRISPGDDSMVWNSTEDFGRFQGRGGKVAGVTDPNGEIRLTDVSGSSFTWEFLKPNDSELRAPLKQTWQFEVEDITAFSISKKHGSNRAAAFRFHVSSPAGQVVQAVPPENLPSQE